MGKVLNAGFNIYIGFYIGAIGLVDLGWYSPIDRAYLLYCV
jgi:hypothetical protein